jgi:hypothetical protein
MEVNEGIAEESTLETFDDLDSGIIEEEDSPKPKSKKEDNWDEDEEVEDESEEKPSEKVKEDLKTLKSREADSEGKVVKDKEEEEEESEEDEEEVEEEETEEDKEEKKESKKLRLRMGDDLFNVDSNATFKVKVDGELQDVPVQELINNFSGKTAWDKKFTELGNEKKQVAFEKQQIEKKNTQLLEHINRALTPIKDAEKNPMDALMYLVEISGEDPYTAYRRLMEANLEEVQTLLDMETETERELYFHKKKDELINNVNAKRAERQKEEVAFNQERKRIDDLRANFNVTEDEFIESAEELEEVFRVQGLDKKDLTNETIVDYASLRPHIAKVKELVAPYEDNISDEKYGDVVASMSRHLRDGKVDVKELKAIIKRNYSVDEDVKELNTKVYSKSQGKEAKKVKLKEQDSDVLETFDEF